MKQDYNRLAIVDYLGKNDFTQLINDNYNRFQNGEKVIEIVKMDNAYGVYTDNSSMIVSGTTHALYRVFNFWQIGELY